MERANDPAIGRYSINDDPLHKESSAPCPAIPSQSPCGVIGPVITLDLVHRPLKNIWRATIGQRAPIDVSSSAENLMTNFEQVSSFWMEQAQASEDHCSRYVNEVDLVRNAADFVLKGWPRRLLPPQTPLHLQTDMCAYAASHSDGENPTPHLYPFAFGPLYQPMKAFESKTALANVAVVTSTSCLLDPAAFLEKDRT